MLPAIWGERAVGSRIRLSAAGVCGTDVCPGAPAPPSNGLAVAGFVVGLVSVFMPLVIGFVMAGVGLGLSIGGLVRAGRIAAGSGLAVAGLVLSIVGLLLII